MFQACVKREDCSGWRGRGGRKGADGGTAARASGGATFSPRSIPYSGTALFLITSENQRAESLGILRWVGKSTRTRPKRGS
jgi:hypothetical protein